MDTIKGPLMIPTVLAAKGLMFASQAASGLTHGANNSAVLRMHGTTYTNSVLFKEATAVTNRRTMATSRASDQTYFWTESWQGAEDAADEDFATGDYDSFESAEDAVAWLFRDDG